MAKNRDRNRNRKGGKGKGGGKNSTSYLSEPFTRKQIRKEIKGLARMEFRESQRQLKSEKRASRAMEGRIGDWFSNYDQELGELSESSSAAYDKAYGQINADSQRAAQYAANLRQKLAHEEMSAAAISGNQAPSGNLANDAAMARMNSANVLSGVTASQGASQAAYMNDKRAIGKRESIEQRYREALRRRSISDDQRALKREKGAFKSAKYGEVVDRERDYMLGAQAANLDSKNARFDRRMSKRQQSEVERSNRANERLSRQQEKRLRQEGRADAQGDRAARAKKQRHARQEAQKNAQERKRENRRLVQSLQAGVEGYDVPGTKKEDAKARYEYVRANRRLIIGQLMNATGNPSRAQATRAYERALNKLYRQSGLYGPPTPTG